MVDTARGEGVTVLVAGGGSAGHVSPMLATAAELQKQYPAIRVLALGTVEGLERDLVPAAGIELLTVEKVPFPRRPSLRALAFPKDFLGTIVKVRDYLKQYRVDAVVGFGGYVCPPAYLAGAMSRVPLVIHEANKRPGLANRLGARFATSIATAFPSNSAARGALAKASWVGMPMRSAIANLDRAARRSAARSAFDLDPDLPTLLVTGGSLGAMRLNSVIVQALDQLESRGVQVLHITGRGKQVAAQAPHYRQVEYVANMEDAYAAADFAVTRSGAGTVCELAAVGLPALFVPLPIGNGEQALNGQDVVEAGGARMIHDSDLTVAGLLAAVDECLLDPVRLAAMQKAAASFGKKDAAFRMVELIAEALAQLPATRMSNTGEASSNEH